MPRVHEIGSLVKLCADCIRKSVDKNKYAGYPREVKPNVDANALIHELPVVLLEEIIRSFTSIRQISDANVLVRLITEKLQHLSFPVYYDGYLNLFPKLGNLLILNIENTEVGDKCLQSIGIHCSKLRSLNLTHCRNVTNTGIQWLCNVDYPGMGNGKSGLCETIKKLCICYTGVTQQGIQVALTHLQSLNILENFYILEALVELSSPTIDSKPPGLYNNNIFSISTLYTSPDKPYISNGLHLALSLCHSVTVVLIHLTKGLKDSDLLCLMSLKVLRKLKIFKCNFWVPNDTEITFDGGVAPLLKVFGRSLETLALECIDLIRISTIIDFCPNLYALYMSDVTGSLENERHLFQSEKKQPVFKELKQLICILDVPVDILLFLFSSPSLEHIVISCCDVLTDEILLETVKCQHRLNNLKKFELDKCDSVTKRGIDALLRSGCNPLEVIDIYRCKNIVDKNYADWNSLIVRKNWNCKITRKW
ncbi:uncharacterized protein LOC124204698 isoform X4 [Daphnia pulex]|uniref:uncharacterized protein LOC124204698 isoform X4 n=1 Tax=Daphnia pulex TaxID=6669 RepID=UPI001EDFCC20|nr:uncharacterized protein LOC124204698 isoform X4 [Daphnia pulex]